MSFGPCRSAIQAFATNEHGGCKTQENQHFHKKTMYWLKLLRGSCKQFEGVRGNLCPRELTPLHKKSTKNAFAAFAAAVAAPATAAIATDAAASASDAAAVATACCCCYCLPLLLLLPLLLKLSLLALLLLQPCSWLFCKTKAPWIDPADISTNPRRSHHPF